MYRRKPDNHAREVKHSERQWKFPAFARAVKRYTDEDNDEQVNRMKSDDPISPLTIIAIFAGIIEASALASLPFLSEQSQSIYTWFLVAFPFFLTVLFFLTLNFNYTSLYKPAVTEPQNASVRPVNAPTSASHRSKEKPSEAMTNAPAAMTIVLSGPDTRKTIEQHILPILTRPSEHEHAWVLYNLDCNTCVNLSVRPLRDNEGLCR